MVDGVAADRGYETAAGYRGTERRDLYAINQLTPVRQDHFITRGFQLNAWERLLISSEVQAKWMNSKPRAVPGSPPLFLSGNTQPLNVVVSGTLDGFDACGIFFAELATIASR